MQKEALQPIADAMFGAAATAFSSLAGFNAMAAPCSAESSEASIRVDAAVVATLTRLPGSGAAFVTRFVKGDIGRVVEMMLGTPGGEGEMDAMQLSIVSETVAQIATAMGEKLATEAGTPSEGVHSEVVTDAGNFPVPPFTSFSSAIEIGDGLTTTVTVAFDGIALSKIDMTDDAPSPEPPPAPRPQAAAPPPSAAVSPSRQARAQAEGQPVQFTPMQPTPIRTAAPGQANLDLVHDVPLEISAVLGQTELSLREVVAMQPGSVFELDKLSTEPIDLYVNNILIARGEVVVVDDKFAVKISELNPVVDRV